MKRFFLTGLVSLVMIMSAGSAMALLLVQDDDPTTPAPNGEVSVGNVDNLIYSTELINSGSMTELTWINTVLSANYEGLFKIEDFEENGYVDWLAVDTAGYDADSNGSDDYVLGNVWAYEFEFDPAPSYYLIKTGTIANSDIKHFLFENYDEMKFAVIDLGEMSGGTKIDISKVSHISAPVPEPATMLLFGVGLAGLAGFSRRKSLKK